MIESTMTVTTNRQIADGQLLMSKELIKDQEGGKQNDKNFGNSGLAYWRLQGT